MTQRPLSPLLVHVPHALEVLPAPERARLTAPDLPGELLRMTDRYCDLLFASRHETVVFPVSRLVCDVERFRDDASEPMARVGMGAVYTRTSAGAPLRSLTPSLRERMLRTWYDPHHQRLTACVRARLDAFGICLIIDGHSFSDTPLPHEPDQRANRPDFCIGTDDFHTPSALLEHALRALSTPGKRVALNTPFSGTIVPLAFCRQDARVHSIMIEVNRKLYMRSDGAPTADFPRIKATLSRLIDTLAAEYAR